MSRLVVLVILLGIPVIGIAQHIQIPKLQNASKKRISFHNLSVEDGLSQNSVVSIAQDSIGYLWFATQDGLNKYDGKTFKYYNKHFEDVTKLNYSKLGKIYIDKKNTTWIITNSGKLEKYNPNTDTFNLVPSISSASNLYQDQNFNSYIGTYSNGLLVIKENTKDTVQLFNKEDINKTVYAFLELQNKIIVSASDAIFSVSKEDFTCTKIISSGKEYVNYSTLTQLTNGIISVGTYSKGLYLLNTKENTITQFKGFTNYILPTDLNIESTLLDNYNRLWVATYGRGVYVINFEEETIENFMTQEHNPFALHYRDALVLFQDFTGNIWVGTDGAGLSYYDEHLLKFNVLTNSQLPRNVYVDVARAITVNPQNNTIWVGTSGKGLTNLDIENKEFKTLTTENSKLKSTRVMSLNYINDELWIGYQDKGLDILDENEKIISYNKVAEKELTTTPIWGIYQDSNRKVWLATGGKGLLKFDKKNGIVARYTYSQNDNSTLSSNYIRSIYEGNPNELWIGTEDKGVCLLNTQTNQVTRIISIKDKIKSLYFDSKNQMLWVGTNGNGLKKLNTKTLETKSYTVDEGLPNNVVYGIVQDSNNNLWLSSNRGITMFKETEAESTIVNYDKYDGLQAFEFNTGAYFKDHNNYMYFGGLDGINWFKPEQLTLNQYKPRTIITGLQLFNEDISLIPNQVFKHDENTISITFSSLHYSQPQLNNYKYRLVNHDKNWIEAGNNNLVNYSNLPPNDYTFEVISSNYDGIWNNTPATYSFSIKKPWYNTTIAWVMYSISLLLISFLIYKYFKWRWHIKTQLQLEHAETIRLKNLDEFKTKLFTNISHEFRTPLTLILGPTENQLSKPKLSKKDKKEFGLIKSSAKRLINLVDQLIDLAKLETGQLKLNVEYNNLQMVLNQLTSSFQYQVEEKEIDFVINISKMPSLWYDNDVVEKVVVNLLANAVKYTPKKGHIYFNAFLQNNHVIISVLNNGSTIESSDLNKLFTRFYQANTNSDGIGIGLALVKELVTLSNGSLVANNLNEDEIQFTITLPVDKEAFKPEDIKEEKPIDNNIKEEKNLSTIDNEEDELDKSDNKPIILIVEDNQHLRKYISSILEDKYKIIKASNGESGIKKAQKNIPDLVISDIMMDKIDGIQLCNILKNDTLTSHIPIILLTAKTGEEDELRGLEMGADDFITKPFNSKILIKRIDNLISLSQSLKKRYSQFTFIEPKEIATTSIDETFFKRVEDVMNKHLSDPNFNATMFSKLMLMSRMQLHRKLLALTGLSTTHFIRSQRLKLAIPLLRNSEFSVSEIAYQVGFNSPSYFNRCFKEVYNCTPNDYIPKK